VRDMNKDRLKNNLIREEGLRLKPYKCTAGKLTIGVGRNIEDRGISEATANQMLDEDIAICIAELELHIPHFNDHPSAVQETLVDLCFNLGISRLKKFKKTLGYIEEGLQTRNYTKAAVELMDSEYARQLPARAKRNHDRLFHAD